MSELCNKVENQHTPSPFDAWPVPGRDVFRCVSLDSVSQLTPYGMLWTVGLPLYGMVWEVELSPDGMVWTAGSSPDAMVCITANVSSTKNRHTRSFHFVAIMLI